MRGCSRGGGGVRGCGGLRGCSWGGCMVAPGGGGVRGFFDEIRSMSGRYASYWNAFLCLKCFYLFVTGTK